MTVVAACALLTWASSGAQNLTPQQLQQLRNLTPEQRAAIERILGGDTSEVGESSSPDAESELQPEPGLAEPDFEEETGEQVLEPGSTVVIQLIPPEELEIEHEGFARAMGSRMYDLDREGAIELPGIGRITLAGLTAQQVVVRLYSEPKLADFLIEASILPIVPTGTDSLEVFGLSLFEGTPTTFAPASDMPVPADYVVGPGDTVVVRLFGKQDASYELDVGRDGAITIPGSGPYAVSGMQFQQLRDEIIARVEREIIGASATVAMGELRSIRVFVLGDVNQPGSYTVSGLATMTNALFVSGGLLPSGSLRDVQLKRKGRIVSRLDLYDLLLRGNTSADATLEPGDVIFVPPAGSQVAIFGEVRRPAIYELRTERTLAQAVQLAGGTLPSALRTEVRIERFTGGDGLNVVTTSLADSKDLALEAGDAVSIFTALDVLNEAVTLGGHVLRSGPRQWRPGMRLTDLVRSPALLKPEADLNYLLVRRLVGPDRHVELLSANLTAALAAPGSDDDTLLMPRDEITVFSIAADRAARIQPKLDMAIKYASPDRPAYVASIGGRVRAPGDYPLEKGMRVSDLVRAAGSLRENAYVQSAELTRYYVLDGGERREAEHQVFDLAAALAGDPTHDVVLEPYDYVNIREIPLWRDQETLEIVGEVKFPGTYTIRRGEYLSAAIERAGGLTGLAFPEGSVFLREDLKEREREQLRRLAERVRTELSALPQDNQVARSDAEQLLTQLEETEPQGRLVIDLNRLLVQQGNTTVDILLENGDQLYIPPRSQEVTVIGEVQYATSHIYTPGLARDSYIVKSGGMTANADEQRVYVVRANGDVISRSGSRWFSKAQANDEIRPGDTIVVPLDADRIGSLALWQSVTQIVYNIGVAAAAVASF
ncbi:MAG: SLBB domain-containing protein [Pseudomonadota bacterium]